LAQGVIPKYTYGDEAFSATGIPENASFTNGRFTFTPSQAQAFQEYTMRVSVDDAEPVDVDLHVNASARIAGFDYACNSTIDNLDLNGDNEFDSVIETRVGETFNGCLVGENAQNPSFGGSDLPGDMIVNVDGSVSFTPAPGEEGVHEPSFYVNDSPAVKGYWLVLGEPSFTGLDVAPFDGTADVVDADKNGVLDQDLESLCQTEHSFRLIGANLTNGVYTVTEMPTGMLLNGDLLTYTPDCADEGSTFTPSFSVDGSPSVAGNFSVTGWPRVTAIDLNNDGSPDIYDADRDGEFDTPIELFCENGYTMQLFGENLTAGVYTATTLPTWASMTPGGEITLNPDCADAGLTFTPGFSVDGSSAVIATMNVSQTAIPIVTGIDTTGDNIPEYVDADRDGDIDGLISFYCEDGFTGRLTGENLTAGVYAGTSLPAGMTLSAAGVLNYAGNCSLGDQNFNPSFSVDGGPNTTAQMGVVGPAVLLGVDTDGNGTVDVADANGDGQLDSTITSTCGSTSTYWLKGEKLRNGVYHGASLPTGMSVSSNGQVTFTPGCDYEAATHNPRFSVDNSEDVTGTFTVPGQPYILGVDLPPFDGNADVVDSNHDGTLDEAVDALYRETWTGKLVSRNASSPSYAGFSLPSGMTLNASTGLVTYNPVAGDAWTTKSPRFSVNGGPTTTMPVDVDAVARIYGIDMNGDGIADAVDADEDGDIDSPISVSCSAPFPYEHTLIVDPPGNFTYFGVDLPEGMGLSQGTGVIGYVPPCSDVGQSHSVGFYASGQSQTTPLVTVSYNVEE